MHSCSVLSTNVVAYSALHLKLSINEVTGKIERRRLAVEYQDQCLKTKRQAEVTISTP